MSKVAFSIRFRLIAAGVLAFAMVAVLAASAMYHYGLTERKSAVVDTATEEFVNLQRTLRGLDEIIFTEGTPAAWSQVGSSVLAFDQVWPRLVAATHDAERLEELETAISPKWERLRSQIGAFLTIPYPGPDNERAMVAFGRLIGMATSLGKDIESFRASAAQSAEAEMRRLATLAAATTLLLAAALLAVFSWAYRGIIRPIARLVSVVGEVAREGDYSLRAAVTSSDEIGRLAMGFNAMLEQVEDHRQQLAAHRDQLEELVSARTLELTLERDRANGASRTKSEFLATMSHEIRTPMNGILGMTELLLGSGLSARQQRFATAAYQSGEHLLNIINDILDFSKIEAGKLEIESTDFDLRALLEDVAYLFTAQADAKGLELICSVPHDVPVAVRGDPVRLRQIMTNLTSNAIKFTSDGEVVIRLRLLDETPQHANFRFEVQDSGIGIESAAQDRLFSAFVQADSSTTRKYGGSGLGLAIVKRLVERMNGEIGLDSQVGSGTLLWFDIRLSKQEATARTVVSRAGDLSGLRVLVVDDNATNREILAHQLAGWSMHHTGAADARSALDELRRPTALQFDLAILDLHMPEMDGFELASAIKKQARWANLPLVMLSSVSVGSDDPDRQHAPIDAYLTKPVRQSDLFDAIATTMAKTKALAAVGGDAPARELVPRDATLPLSLTGRVLVAEDNPVNQQVAEAMLEALGIACQVVDNGRLAVERVLKEPFDVVLMDCQMPEMDGFEATTEIRARQREGRLHGALPIVALTANAVQGDRERCLAAGMDDYLGKPFTLEQLANTLRRLLPSVAPATTTAATSPSRAPAPAEATPSDSDEPLNPRALDAIRQLPGPNGALLVARVIDAYRVDAPQRLAQMRRAADDGDADALRKGAHAMKSSSANVGAEQLAARCTDLEAIGHRRTVDGASAVLEEVECEFRRVLAALEGIRSGSSENAVG